MLLELSFVVTLVFVCLFIYSLSRKGEMKIKKRYKNYVGETKPNANVDIKKGEENIKKKINFFRKKGSDYYTKKLSTKQEEKLEKALLKMGNPWSITSAEFQFYILLFRICFPLSVGIFEKLIGGKLLVIILLMLASFVMSIFLPNIYISSKIKKRYTVALKELPDFLDLLTVSLEAGLGFDLAMNKVISKSNGVLASEFHICLEEIRLGKTRRDSFIGLKERLNFPSLVSLINSILQGEKLGMSMVQIFRIKSQEERDKRRQRAEEAAMKVPVKILFPLVFFIFPSLFIVLLGPVAIELINGIGK
ncbi:type II secretion system F family protein [Candidatus Clostridium stratigraminis]|uniref:Type II secretion system F family protein n=1 Tax=Candidatus Clostridium stratigraminis TaxID=3381661 RepID=A0ABW8T6R2_9CLOT